VGGPAHPEVLAAGGEFADEIGQGFVVGVATGLGAQVGDDIGRGLVPIDEELPGARVEEGEPRDVGWLDRLGVDASMDVKRFRGAFPRSWSVS
jgi:hypothetical protein